MRHFKIDYFLTKCGKKVHKNNCMIVTAINLGPHLLCHVNILNTKQRFVPFLILTSRAYIVSSCLMRRLLVPHTTRAIIASRVCARANVIYNLLSNHCPKMRHFVRACTSRCVRGAPCYVRQMLLASLVHLEQPDINQPKERKSYILTPGFSKPPVCVT